MRSDTCPSCRGQMTFHAITTAKGVWRRWVECQKCSHYVSADAHGGDVYVGKSMPPKAALAKNEVTPDEGSSTYRI